GDVDVSPGFFFGALMEFKGLYAVHLAAQARWLDGDGLTEDKPYPTFGFTYDLVLKLYKSDPPAFFTPIGVFGISKEWLIVKSQDSAIQRFSNDISDWQMKLYLGADFALTQNFHIKAVGGAGLLLADNMFFTRKVFPAIRLSSDFAF
ncbi:MAG TPA: hypothetical protein VEC36_03840, partial [Patescibacteria group bacterium]|nr:hypothetical protein [Patescibacteria group bacterium]